MLNGSNPFDIDFAVVPLRAVLLMTEQLCLPCREKALQLLVARLPGLSGVKESRPSMAQIISGISMETQIPPAMILCRLRRKELVAARRRVVSTARGNGYTVSEIAAVLKMHHTSVCHLLKTKA
jgi:signal recognition particle GTPase